MGRRIKLTAEALPKSLNRLQRGLKMATELGVVKGASKGLSLLERSTPEDLGNAKDAWELRGAPDVTIKQHNSAPYVGVLETGARPHEVNQEGRARIQAWAERKLGLDQKEAKAAMYAIVNKIRKKGTKPTFFVRQSLPALTETSQKQVAKELVRFGRKFRG